VEYKVTLTPKARRDLTAIWNYIARDDRDAATAFCHDLAQQAYSLKIFPERNFELPERRNVRRISYQSYLIFYEVHANQNWVEILRFWHGARDQGRLRLREESSPAYSSSPIAVPATA
jgi:plasmid stabilization system protein ParE